MKRVAETYVTVALRIRKATVSYSFGVTVARYEPGPYGEYTSLKCVCVAERSELTQVDGEFDVTILGRRDLANAKPAKDGTSPIAVGELDYARGRRNALLSVPWDALVLVLPEIQSGRTTHIVLHGTKQRGGRLRVRFAHFEAAEALEDHL